MDFDCHPHCNLLNLKCLFKCYDKAIKDRGNIFSIQNTVSKPGTWYFFPTLYPFPKLGRPIPHFCWVQKNWCFWTVMLEKTLESPLDCKEIQPVHSKGDQSWVFIGRTDAEAETPIFWPPDTKSWLIWKGLDVGKDWRQEEKGKTEDEMVGWHHQLDGHEFGWTPGVGDGQGGLACCGSWGHKESDMTERLNWTPHFSKI